ncbi:MAG: DM13 domain-containing protein [Spirosoma sp.]|nr:DM13 domain-containing protein [Spirosoma sp.]
MKTLHTFLASLFLLSTLVSCGTKETVEPTSSAPPLIAPVTVVTTVDTVGQKMLSTGTFAGANRYTVGGTVSVFEKAGKRTLVFTNFTASSGPDLRIYVAENMAARNFVELTKLNNSGNFTLDLPTGIDPTKQNFVLIWCKAFSVSFGSAELK